MTELILALIGAALINNIVLQHTLALDPLLREGSATSRPWVHALGLATLLAMLLVCTLGQLLYLYILQPLHLDYLRLFVFLPLCVLTAAPLLAALQRWVKPWPFDGLKPLLTGNAALLGLCLLLSDEQRGVLPALAVGLGSGLGFWLVLALFDDLRQRSLHDDVPPAFRGLPIELMGAGIMAMAFLGFSGLFTS
ncbi:Rnf-Nqr domain containing protein [Pseudomonas sp. 148P]|uniref:Rnf-Nqr domain containing protein n=1 Tax=Pseudomonas ulcerans TaxID=3115852 RepID=A0ABU7HM27_9PSED|nr:MULTISPECIES: Rnf-Nqr domain containing protein [unclassified Pseudomonas]MEE1921069.1 Rnf-Nqr domain containing protein [Pseudomonas sp. 147P]MEE1932582.1 Rnf-Nqr domain containing protein [Pseudomonas sp. 148P]